MAEAVCAECGQTLPIQDFAREKATGIRRDACRRCVGKLRQRAYRERTGGDPEHDDARRTGERERYARRRAAAPEQPNKHDRWTVEDARIAADLSRPVAEAAAVLGRSSQAVMGLRHRIASGKITVEGFGRQRGFRMHPKTSRNPERDAAIIERVVVRGERPEVVAPDFGIGVERIKQIAARYRASIRHR